MDSSFKIDTLPREIMAEILLRLPVESLIRLKSLNKSWYFFIRCLINDPEFVSKHLRYAESSPTLLLVCKQKRSLFKLPEKNSVGLAEGEDIFKELQVAAVQFRLGDDNNTLHCTNKHFNLPRCLSRFVYRGLKAFCCNGIVCLAQKAASSFTLYNPALCEFDTFNPCSNLDLGLNNVAGIGFGSDSTGSVYKVVRFFTSMKAEVFVPGGASDSWRAINISVKKRFLFTSDYPVYLKGNCFWSSFDFVLCFDVGREVFHNIPLPEEAVDCALRGLSRSNDSICVLLGSRDDVEVWALDVSCRGGCDYSWKKILNSKVKFRTFWGVDRGEVFVETDEILSFNVHDGKVRRLPFRLTSAGLCYFDRYVESLVSIKNLIKARRTT